MIFYEGVYRAAYDPAHGQAAGLHGLLQLVPEVICDRAGEADRELPGVGILQDVPFQECGEPAAAELLDIWEVPVFRDERRERREEPARVGFAVDFLHDGEIVESVSSGEFVAEFRGHHTFDEIRDERLSEISAAALIPEDEASGIDVADDLAAVIKACVGAGSEYAGYSFPASAESPCRGDYVRGGLYLRTWENGLQAFPEPDFGISDDASPIEVDFVGHACSVLDGAERLHDLPVLGEHRIDALSLDFDNRTVGRDRAPSHLG